MKTIHKHLISVQDNFPLDLPKDSRILTVQKQNHVLLVWVLCDVSKEKETRYFRIIGTGWDIEDADGLEYIDTFQQADGNLVWHLFEEYAK